MDKRPIEIGPIRPPSEAASLLLRITRNCTWNKCKFCNLYTGQRFSTRSIEDIKADIDQIASMTNHRLSIKDSVFLQDANTMALAFDKLYEILCHTREKLPHVKRVTSYGRADSLAKFSVQQLTQLREAGLDRIHAGYESGSDKVLQLINKGYTKEHEIDAGQKVKSAGIELSIYYMPGVGGKELSHENAIETADVVSKINPDFVRIRTFVPKPGTGLQEDIDAGLIEQCTDLEKFMELKKMIENIHSATGMLYSDHIINLFEDIQGNMATDKEEIVSTMASFEELDDLSKRRYQIARRTGWVRLYEHMEIIGNERIQMIDECLSQLDTEEKFESFLLRFLRSYI